MGKPIKTTVEQIGEFYFKAETGLTIPNRKIFEAIEEKYDATNLCVEATSVYFDKERDARVKRLFIQKDTDASSVTHVYENPKFRGGY